MCIWGDLEELEEMEVIGEMGMERWKGVKGKRKGTKDGSLRKRIEAMRKESKIQGE